MLDPFYVFDYDGVLANTLPIALEEYRRITRDSFPMIPSPIGPEDLAYLFPGPLRTSLRRFGINDSESRTFFDLHSSAMRDRTNDVQLFTPVVEILAELPPQRRAIVTSSYSVAVRNALKQNGFADLELGVQVFGRELHLPKSEKFRLIAANNGVDLKQMVKIGDMVSDLLYAREAGIAAWAVGWGYHPLPYLAAFEPDEYFETHAQLRKRILGG